MTYTLWSRGRLLGESPLDFVRCMPRLRVGFLHPTPLGETLLPGACGASPASIAWERAVREARVDSDREEPCRLPEYASFDPPVLKKPQWRSSSAIPEEREWMRYQLQVTLVHDWSIP